MENLPPIIHSLLDNDFYKFTMQNAVTKLFPTARVRYRFVNRADTTSLPGLTGRCATSWT